MNLRGHRGVYTVCLGLALACGTQGGETALSGSESSGADPLQSGSEARASGAETSADTVDDGTSHGTGVTGPGAITATTATGTSTSTTTTSMATTSTSIPTTEVDTMSSDTSTDDTIGVGGPVSRVYILFGQSNMWGQTSAEDQDMDIHPRVEVLTLEGTCPGHGANMWVTATPSLHGCVGNPGDGSGAGLGPGDYFAKTLAAAHPEDSILLVPNAIPGASINCFAPPDIGLTTTRNCPNGVGPTYESMVARSRMAQERGEIRGIIFHQGESDCGQDDWPQRVKTVVDRLRSDLDIGDVPFLAAEIPGMSGCQDHNRLFEGAGSITEVIANAHVVQAEDLPIYDAYHFTTEAQRTLGARFGEMMLQVE